MYSERSSTVIVQLRHLDVCTRVQGGSVFTYLRATFVWMRMQKLSSLSIVEEGLYLSVEATNTALHFAPTSSPDVSVRNKSM